MPIDEIKRNIIKEVLKKVKLHDAGVKRKKHMEVSSVSSGSGIDYPNIHLDAKEAPELVGYDVDDKVILIIEGKITSHSKNDRIGRDSHENFGIEIRKIAVSTTMKE